MISEFTFLLITSYFIFDFILVTKSMIFGNQALTIEIC